MEIPSNQSRDILSPHVADVLRQEASQYTTPRFYLEFLQAKYRNTMPDRLLTAIAQAIEPADRVLGIDEDRPFGMAFYMGGLLGLRAVDEGAGRKILSRMPGTDVGMADVKNIKDGGERSHKIAAGLIENSEIGYANAAPYHELLEDWEDALVADVGQQRFVKRGFGYIIFAATRTIAAVEADEMSAWVKSTEGNDWDAALSEL
jgi:hypothetical protein